MNSKIKVRGGIAAGGLVAALIAFGSGGMGGMGGADSNSVQAGMAGKSSPAGAGKGTPNAGKSSGGVSQQTSGSGI